MKIISDITEIRELLTQWRHAGKKIAFVPTMGYLHKGHLSLIELARKSSDVVVVSIFVNPMQFGPREDLDKYPRDIERDTELCRGSTVDVIFCPTVDQMYPQNHSVFVDEALMSRVLCGASRPTHFRGVLTVVAKLFNIVQPDIAIFGQKDAQQLQIVRRMVRDLNFPVEIVAGSTVREADGLAMSSRNVYLSTEERAQAVCLRQALYRAEELYARGERSGDTICQAMRNFIGNFPTARIDYVEVVAQDDLQRLSSLNKPALALLAVFIGQTRLIDNTFLGQMTGNSSAYMEGTYV